MLSVQFGKFCIVHTKLASISVCTPVHNYLLQAFIDIHRENCENEWRSQPFVLLLFEISNILQSVQHRQTIRQVALVL